MVDRLVLGCGAVGFDLLEAMPRREALTVVTADRSRAESLRDVDVNASTGDPTDPATYPDDADVVVVAGADPERNRLTAHRAAEAFPDAVLVVYAGDDADPSVLADLKSVADRVVDPVAAVATTVLDLVVGPESERARRLRRVLLTAAEPLAVVCHDNPDPDAIASALALACIAENLGVEAEACYYGEISHQENRALVNLLDLPLVNLGPGDVERYGSVALVDHSRAGVNDSLPPETEVDVVVDHHPPRGPVEGRFVDLRSDVGATSTLLTQYLERFDVEPGRLVATALLYGIQVDTRNFTREVSEHDFDAAAYLWEWADEDALVRIESPSVSADTMEVLARAVENRTVSDGALATCVGEIRKRDALAQAADLLLDMEDIHTTLVYGFAGGAVYVSGRTRGADIDLGETLREAFGRIGSAGGHADMAGAQIPLGILAEVGADARTSLTEVVRSVIDERFYGALLDAPSAPTPDSDLTYEYDDAASVAMRGPTVPESPPTLSRADAAERDADGHEGGAGEQDEEAGARGERDAGDDGEERDASDGHEEEAPTDGRGEEDDGDPADDGEGSDAARGDAS